MSCNTHYDVIVIGGGHAGAEAAWAACNVLAKPRDGHPSASGKVALITMDPSKIGAMSCNPAIGGLAKGQIVREIDAMGGIMGRAADATGIQFRVLNQSKGPAVRGPRCQSDKYAYAAEVQRLLGTRENLTVLPGVVEDFVVKDGRCVGVQYRGGHGPGHPQETADCCGEFCAIDDADKSLTLSAGAVVLTTGTFMRALMHSGETQTKGGRIGEGSAEGISGALQRLGFELGRLKTGTPPRLDANTIDYSQLEIQPGDDEPTPFSLLTAAKPRGEHPSAFPSLHQTPCWITHTSEASHQLIRDNLDRAPMYNGQIETAGPRYCPSIEDKVVRFADRTSHHVFLEPESLSTNEIYCNGISTSLPPEVQLEIVRNLPGCENAKMLKPGYAVEYDMVWPHQIDASCMTKRLPGLLLAGQINGTSGYEEAAGQGLIAGLNAARYALHTDADAERGFASEASGISNFTPTTLRRDQAYIGVMLDDLVTKTPREPYRMFTSRAEHRLRLRSDNAEARLTPLARELGLVDDHHWATYEELVSLRGQLEADPNALADHPLHRHAAAWLAADRQYAGYIERSDRELQRLAEQEATPLPATFDFKAVKGLRSEAATTLDKFRPSTLGQAGRLAGVNPADLMLLNIALKRSA
jgi:tRNA uridine 5-carboxymethylaminomethyl modification enzyme